MKQRQGCAFAANFIKASWQVSAAIYLLVLAACTVCALLYLLNLLSADKFAAAIKEHPGQFDDFCLYYSFCKLAFSVNHSLLYDVQAQMQMVSRVIPGGCPGPSFLQYPPFFALLVFPFISLPVNCAFVAWSFFGIGFGLFGLSKLGLSADRRRLWPFCLTALAVLSSLPSWRCLILGQLSWILLGFFALFFACLRDRKDLAAGGWLAAICVKPHWAACAFLIALALKRWKVLLIMFGFLLAFILICALAFGPSVVLAYPQVLASQANDPANLFIEQVIVAKGLFHDILPPAAASLATYVLFLTGAAGIFGLWRNNRKQLDASFNTLTCLTVVAILVIGVYGHIYDCLLLAIPATLHFCDARSCRQPQAAARSSWLSLTFWAYPLLGWLSFMALSDKIHIFSRACLLFDVWLLCLFLIAWRQPIQLPASRPALDNLEGQTN